MAALSAAVQLGATARLSASMQRGAEAAQGTS